jgi:hypothetical protein
MRLALVSLALVCGCGGASASAYTVAQLPASRGGERTVRTAELAGRTTVARASSPPSFWFEGDAADEQRPREAASPTTPPHDLDGLEEAPLYAQAQTSATPQPPTATDAIDTSGELLIYTALFHVGVYDVAAAQAALAESVRSIGGFVFAQSDDSIVVRVPASRFVAFVATIDGSYDVLHRQIDAQDVGEEFRDVEVRIRNLEQMRDRVAALLASATDVEQALAVERQLERITAELESMRGRQRFLADRISFSTITVMFRPQPRDAIDQPEVFQLPFAWLESLGLSNLLQLR